MSKGLTARHKRRWISGWTFRRALALSAAIHVGGALTAVVLARAEFEPPEEKTIPVQLLADLAPMPAAVPPEPKKIETPKVAPDVADPLVKPEKKIEPKPKPPEPKEKPPVKEPKPETVEPQKIGAVEPEVVPKKAPERPTLGDDTMVIEVEGPPFEFAYYLKQIRRKIASKWSPPPTSLLAGQETRARVYFRVDRGGRIVDARLENESGSFLFDQSVLRALEQASPLPPLPDGYAEQWLGLHIWFVEES